MIQDLSARDDGHSSHDFNANQFVGIRDRCTDGLCKEYYNDQDATTYMYSYPISDHHTHVSPPRSHFSSEYVDSRTAFFKDTDNGDDRTLLAELKAYDPHRDQNDIIDDIKEGENSYEQFLAWNRSDNCQYEYDALTNSVVEDFGIEEHGPIRADFEQIYSTMKQTQYDSFHDDSARDHAYPSFNWSDGMLSGIENDVMAGLGNEYVLMIEDT
jgi:hypothetical protein